MATLEKESFVPLYYQLKEEIKEKIQSGEWECHTCIPSVRELCETYEISTTTVKQALSELVHEGLLYTVRGKGTFVSPPHFPMKYGETTLISDDMRLATRIRSLGHQFAAEVLSVDHVKGSKMVSGYLSIQPGSDVLRIRRLKKVDSEPMLIETTFIATETSPLLENEDLGRSLFRLLSEKCGITLRKSKETFCPVFLDTVEAELLNQRVGALALLNERISFADTPTPILYAKSLIRGDMCKTYMDLTNLRSIKDMVSNASSF